MVTAGLLVAAEARQRALDVLPPRAVEGLARDAVTVPRRLVGCRSWREGWFDPSRTRTACVRAETDVPLRWTRVVWHGHGPDHVEREWEAPAPEGTRYFPPLRDGGRCPSLQVARAPGGVTLLRCESQPAGHWALGLRDRPRGASWWSALGAAVLATAWAASLWARREPRCRLPWRVARRGADGVHRLDDGRPVRLDDTERRAEVRVVLKDTAEAPYRAEEALATARTERVSACFTRRERRVLACCALACGLTVLAHALR